MTVFKKWSCYIDIKAKHNFEDNQACNVLTFLDILPNFHFITSEMKRDYQ